MSQPSLPGQRQPKVNNPQQYTLYETPINLIHNPHPCQLTIMSRQQPSPHKDTRQQLATEKDIKRSLPDNTKQQVQEHLTKQRQTTNQLPLTNKRINLYIPCRVVSGKNL